MAPRNCKHYCKRGKAQSPLRDFIHLSPRDHDLTKNCARRSPNPLALSKPHQPALPCIGIVIMEGNTVQAFVQAVPLLSQRRAAEPRPRICMVEEPKEDTSSKPADQPRPSSKPIKAIRSNASWANTFLPEFGRKGPGSRPDWDLRPTSLRSEEDGKGICDNCKGTGTMTCTFCSGLIHVTADGTVRPCPACNGQTTVTCSVCFGTLKQIEMVCVVSL